MKKDKKQKTLQRIMEYMKPYRFLIFASLVLAVISVALTLYVPILTGQGVDCIISKGNVDFARLISIIKTIMICIVLTAAAQWLMNHVNNQITYKIGKDLRIQAFEHLQKLPLSYVDAHSSGDLISRIVTDIDQFTGWIAAWIYTVIYWCDHDHWNHLFYVRNQSMDHISRCYFKSVFVFYRKFYLKAKF